MSVPVLTAERLREVLNYDPETGIFTWKLRTSWRVRVGDFAGSQFGKRRQIGVDGVDHYVHRLAWLYVYGVWPASGIDHMNGDPSDNRICNLREATQAQNMQNLRKADKDSKTGFLGVSEDKKKFTARIMANGKKYHLGNFSTPEEAHAAYVQAKRRLHEFNTL
jgi:HNH endonuclease/AP2 domain